MRHFQPSYTPAEGLGSLVLFQLLDLATPDFFAADRRIHVTRAPGRLAVLGEISSALRGPGLQITVGEAASVAIQARADDQLRLWSPHSGGARSERLSTRLSDLGLPAQPLDRAEARAFLCLDPNDRWAAYLLVGLLLLARRHGLRPTQGFDLLVHSQIPASSGLGASTAVATAGLLALLARYELPLPPAEVMQLVAEIEQWVVGELGRVADAATTVFGAADQLLLSRRGEAAAVLSLPVPAELEFLGLAIGGAAAADPLPELAVLRGASEGFRLLQAQQPAVGDGEWPAAALAGLPAALPGSALLPAALAAPGLRLQPAQQYPVRAASAWLAAEAARAEQFVALWQQAAATAAVQLGELLYAADAAQRDLGLGSPAASFLVATAKARQAAGAALYGAKAAPGGGVVLLFGARGQVWYEALRLKKALLEQHGLAATVFRWSTPGAAGFPTVELVPSAD